MSRLEELIKELCPDGVEYVKLTDVAPPQRGARVIRSQLASEGRYPVFQNSMTPLGYYEESNCPADTAFVISAGAAGEVGYSGVDFWAADDCFYFQCPENLSNRYLYYALMTRRGYLFSRVRRASVPRLSRLVIEQLQIPLPPLPIQREIVRILDNFTELTAGLTAELTAELEKRKKQYAYYRDELLTFGDDVPMVPLGEIADFKYGFTDTAKNQGAARFIRITDIGDNGKLQYTDCKYVDLTENSEKYLLEEGDLLMARTGATYAKTMLFDSNEPSVYASFLIRLRFAEDEVLPAYYWHFAQSSLYWNQANKLVSKAGQPQFNANVLKTLVMPLPTIEVQKKIVDILTRFDALVNDITSGLPDEIEARRKQYEYYRDKLLTFKRKEVGA